MVLIIIPRQISHTNSPICLPLINTTAACHLFGRVLDLLPRLELEQLPHLSTPSITPMTYHTYDISHL